MKSSCQKWKNSLEYIYMSNFLNAESDSQDDILLPINTLYPPNQIISKTYSPDVKPGIKLIQPQKKSRRRITLPTEAPSGYGEVFQQRDSLGFQYASLLKSKLVYLRFNNAPFMRIPGHGKQPKYVAGMFIPLQKLLAQSLKKARNIYKTLPNFDFIDNRHPYQCSFSNNCFSSEPNLRFTSNYEGSNLFAAVKVGQNQYDLILQNDINSKGNTQWFNFTVEINEQKNYKFNIINLTKSSSLYQKGMSVVYFSQSAKLYNKTGWSRGCHSISYQPTSVTREGSQHNVYHCLHFEYKSLYKNDVVTFAYSFPYNIIDLEKFFNKVMMKRTIGSLKVQKMKIGQTLTGFALNVYSFIPRKHQSKKILGSSQTLAQGTINSSIQNLPSVVFMARQHPGQSQSSYITEGVVQWLLEGDYDSWKKHYHFYVIPMVNMDGVYYGNYRTNLSGSDLNRVWRQPRKDYHCQIYALKKFMYNLNKANPISLIIDIHGHSNSLNSFFYGNPPKKQLQNPRLFPYYCSRKIKQVSFHQSTFGVSEDKKSCARVVLSEMFPKAFVYTFQNSFYAWKKGKTAVEHTIESYRKIGRDLVQSYIEFARLCDKNPAIKDRWAKQIQEMVKQSKENTQEIVSQSEGQLENELIQFDQIYSVHPDLTFVPEFSLRMGQKKKTIPLISKNRYMKYIKRPSPMKIQNYSTANDTYFLDKAQQTSQSQGFLSIVKINTKSNIESATSTDNFLKVKNKERDIPLKTTKDFVLEDFSEDSIKENNESNTRVKKLITQKEMIKEKLRINRRKIQEGMIHSKTYNGFFRYNYVKKT